MENVQDFKEQYNRFIKGIAFIFLFDVLATVFIVIGFIVPSVAAFFALVSIGGACAGMAIGQKLIMLHRIYRGTKWNKV